MQVWYNGYYESLPRIRWGFDYPYLLQRGVVDTLIYPLGGLKPCMVAMRTLRKRQTRGEAVIEGRTESFKNKVKSGVLLFDTGYSCAREN